MNNFSDTKVIMFDLDGTLAESKSPPDAEMTGLIHDLLEKKSVAIISGGMFEQLHGQFASHLPTDSHFEKLYILPTSGGSLYAFVDTEWKQIYTNALSLEESVRVIDTLKDALTEAGYVTPETIYGEIIEDRGSQITFSGLGQHAPLALKETFDPDKILRTKVIALLEKNLPDFECTIGGITSIDITRRGVDKAYGVRKLSEFLNIPISDMLYVGDELKENGNDFVAKSSGIRTHEIKNPEETKELIQKILNNG